MPTTHHQTDASENSNGVRNNESSLSISSAITKEADSTKFDIKVKNSTGDDLVRAGITPKQSDPDKLSEIFASVAIGTEANEKHARDMIFGVLNSAEFKNRILDIVFNSSDINTKNKLVDIITNSDKFKNSLDSNTEKTETLLSANYAKVSADVTAMKTIVAAFENHYKMANSNIISSVNEGLTTISNINELAKLQTRMIEHNTSAISMLMSMVSGLVESSQQNMVNTKVAEISKLGKEIQSVINSIGPINTIPNLHELDLTNNNLDPLGSTGSYAPGPFQTIDNSGSSSFTAGVISPDAATGWSGDGNNDIDPTNPDGTFKIEP